MKRLLRHFIIDTLSLYAVSTVADGMIFEKGIITLVITGFAITAVSFLAKPVINLLLMPLNLVTFGVFRWVSSAIVLFLVTLVVKQFKIVGFTFGGFTSAWIDIPALNLTGLPAYIAFSLLLSFLLSFIYWLIK